MARSHGALIGWAFAALLLSQTSAQARPEPAADVATFEAGFSAALARNDVGALKRYLSEDWTIISGDGGTITRARFLAVIRDRHGRDRAAPWPMGLRLHPADECRARALSRVFNKSERRCSGSGSL
jgi:hypothetical protein